jgi:hypothetical protein
MGRGCLGISDLWHSKRLDAGGAKPVASPAAAIPGTRTCDYALTPDGSSIKGIATALNAK